MTPTALHNLLRQYERLLTEQGVLMLRRGVFATIVSGVLQGLALLALLAGAAALADGEPVGGLSAGGWTVVLAVLGALGFGAAYVLSMKSYQTAQDILRNSHVVVGDHLSSLPIGWFSRDIAGRLSRTMTAGAMTLGQVIAHMLMGLIANLASLVVVVLGLWLWNTTLAIIVTIAVAVYIGGMQLIALGQNRAKRWAEPSKTELSSRVVEYARAQAALRAAGRSNSFEPLTDAVAEENRVSKKALWLESGLMMIAGMAAQVVVVVLIVTAAMLASSGELDPLPALAFVGLSLRLMQHLAITAELSIGLQEQGPVLASINEVLDSEIMPEPEQSRAPAGAPTIELDGVTFGYESERPVVRDVSFTVPPRTMTALVGPSGAGKTTVARLVARFYDVDTGVVRVAGEDVRDYTIADLMSQLAMVFQDVYLFDDTLIENIRVGRPDASDDEVRAAADRAGVTEIVHRLPDGWDTRVREGGIGLSGGERQRVSIARALLKHAPIAIIDEATSALDVENERNIVAAVDELRTHATVLIIAHKLDTIQSADQVVVLSEEGTVVQAGRHEELIRVDGLYRRYWDQRQAAQGWSLA